MRVYSVIAYCDACPGENRKQSVQTYTVGITEGEERPALHTLDMCEEHAAMMNSVAKLLVGAEVFAPAQGRRGSTASPKQPKVMLYPPGHVERQESVALPAAVGPSEPTWPAQAEPEPPKRELKWPPASWTECPVCDQTMRRSSVVTHVWEKHRPEGKRPEAPTACPDCRFVDSETKYIGLHRSRVHGFNALKDALSGVPGYELTDKVAAPEVEEVEPEESSIPAQKKRSKAPMDYCPICGAEMRRPSLVSHVWMKHRRGEVRPPYPTTCPDCGWHSLKKEQVGQHRSYKHGYDPVAEALAGVKVLSK